MNRSVSRFGFKVVIFIVFVISFALGQSDTLVVEFNDGSVSVYPLAKVLQVSFSGTPTTVQEQELVQNVLRSFALHQNFPNPFNPSTTIEYELPSAGELLIEIFDIEGRLVRTFDPVMASVGVSRVSWDCRDNVGAILSSGVYFCRIQFNGISMARRMLLLR